MGRIFFLKLRLSALLSFYCFFKSFVGFKMTLDARTILFNLFEGRRCSGIEKVIAQVKVHVLRCITVIFECDACPSSKT